MPMNTKAMSEPAHTSPPPAMVSRRHTPPPAEGAARLAHELANLLDGSLRHVGLALRTLERGDSGTLPDVPLDDEALTHRLTTARDAMQQMAQLIHRWLRESRSVDSLYQHSRSLGQSVAHAFALFQPAALAQKVELTAEVAADAARLPAGPLDPVLLNSLRNSLEALAALPADATSRCIEVIARIQQHDLILTVRDSGPGLAAAVLDDRGQLQHGRSTKPGGHGLGLSLCRAIVSSLGGSLQLTSRGDGARGAELTAQVPVTGLVNPGDGI